MKKLRSLLIVLLPLLLLSGCTKYGKLDEGDCKGIIAFAERPKSFSMMEDELQEQVKIRVRLKNITTEKVYLIELNKENEYKQELSLHPGVYQVIAASADNSRYTGVSVKAASETMEFTAGQEARLDIVVKDAGALTNRWMDTQPLPEIRLADMYSGMIQINRKVISIRDILPELKFSSEKNIEAYQKENFTDEERGITVTVQNMTKSPLFYDECEVIGIEVQSNVVVFPEGVTIGSKTESVCHQKNGIYGEPTSFQGMTLFGWNLANTYAVYQDPTTGNRITIGFDGSGEHIDSIRYELSMFEEGTK